MNNLLNMRNMKSPVFVTVTFMVILGFLFGPVRRTQAQSTQSWSVPVNLSNSGGASNPLLLVDGEGVIHALWVDKFDGYKHSTSTDGLNWTPPQTANFPFTPNDFPPVLLVDSGGLIHIFWRTKDNDLRYGQTL